MAEIVVFSDSHGMGIPMQEVVAKLHPDQVLFLGDGWSDASALMKAFPQIPMVRVPGNCDFHVTEEKERLVVLYGKRIYMCHGHTQQVKMTMDRLLAMGRRLKADIVLYGHTHISHCEWDGRMWVMNPGAIGSSEQRYGLITIQGDKVDCRICEHRSRDDRGNR